MSRKNQQEIIEILLKAEEYDSILRKKLNKQSNSFYYKSINICLILLSFSLLSIGVSFLFKNWFIMFAALVFIVFAILVLFLSTAIDIYKSRKGILWFFKKPIYLLLQNSEFNIRSQSKFFSKLITYEVKDLNLVKQGIIFEKDSFDKRTSILAGTIDKIGIFPTILATFILIITQLSNINIQNFLNVNPNLKLYFYAAIFIVFFFQIFSVRNCLISLKLTKMIEILEYILIFKKDKE